MLNGGCSVKPFSLLASSSLDKKLLRKRLNQYGFVGQKLTKNPCITSVFDRLEGKGKNQGLSVR